MVAMNNIWISHQGDLESTLSTMEQLHINVGLFMEAKLMKGMHTRFSSGYLVDHQMLQVPCRGGDLFLRTMDQFQVEEVKVQSLNVISFYLVMGLSATLNWVLRIPNRYHHNK